MQKLSSSMPEHSRFTFKTLPPLLPHPPRSTHHNFQAKQLRPAASPSELEAPVSDRKRSAQRLGDEFQSATHHKSLI